MTNTEIKITPRNQTLDVLRGLAIATMILSNFAGEMLKAPHPFILTVLGSLAAPLFVMIAGFLVGFSVLNKNYPLSYFLLRGFLTWVVAASIDTFLWKSYPFISVDVLYLTGLALPLTALFMRMNLPFKIVFVILIFATAPMLRGYFGYVEKPSFPLIWKEGHFIPFEGQFTVILKHWFVDGWFPIFSWIGIAFTGALLAQLRLRREILTKRDNGLVFIFGIVFLIIGILFWNTEFRLAARGNYTELFYPPTLSYYSAYFGGILLLYLLVEWNSNLKIYTPLRLLGVSPLFFYFMHFLIISKFIAPAFGKTTEVDVYLSMDTFFLAYFLLILFCLFLALLILLIKKKYPTPPFLIKFFIGG